MVCLLRSHIVFQKLGQGEQTRYLTSLDPFTQSELLWSRFPFVCRQQLLQNTSPPALLGGFWPNLTGMIHIWPSSIYLFKWFYSILYMHLAQMGWNRLSNWKKSKYKKHWTLTLNMKHYLVNVYQVCSNYGTGAKDGSVLGLQYLHWLIIGKHKTHLLVWTHKDNGLDMSQSVHLCPSVCLELLSINHWPDLIHFGLNVYIHWGLSLHSLTLHTHVQNHSFIKTTDALNIDSCNVGSDYVFPWPYEWWYQVSDQGPKIPLV